MGGKSGKSRGGNGVVCTSSLIKFTKCQNGNNKDIEGVTCKQLSSLSMFKFQQNQCSFWKPFEQRFFC